MTKASPAIQVARQSDLAAILDLYAQTGLDDGVRIGLPQAEELFRRLAAYPHYRLFVVKIGRAHV